MKVDGRHTRTLWLEPDGWAVGTIDQRQLPHRFVTVRLETLADAAEAIRSMLVRGAPLIGATAAYGVCLAPPRRLWPEWWWGGVTRGSPPAAPVGAPVLSVRCSVGAPAGWRCPPRPVREGPWPALAGLPEGRFPGLAKTGTPARVWPVARPILIGYLGRRRP